ncbi:copper resistance protein CopC [Actinomadura sp. 3N407]|uniref:copper resistance protein CopC n=1 Tax=Actinomadura sp. 3N407 TaxID=3457423 RepID=UPI003FCE4AA2
MRRFLSLPLVCAGILAWAAVPAHAHTGLKDASPGPGAEVAPGVTVISLTLDKLKPGTTPQIGITGPGQAAVHMGEPEMIDDEVVCATVTPLTEGVHTLTYTTVATDGETQTSKFYFTAAVGAQPAAVPAACDGAALLAPGAGYSWTGLGTTTAMLVLGGVLCAGIVWAGAVGRARGRRRRRVAW